MELGRLYVASQLEADGVRDAAEVADALVRLAASYSLMPSAVVDIGDEAAVHTWLTQVVIEPVVVSEAL